MANKFNPRDVLGSGRTQAATLPDTGWAQQAQVLGDCASYNTEVTTSGGAQTVTLGAPVRSIVVWCQADTYFATAATSLAGAGNGKDTSGRFLVKANERRELPWYQDEVNLEATAGNLVTIEGRI